MKKSLLLSAVLFTAVVFVKAQDPVTWIADDYCTGLGLAADAIALTPNQQITVGDVTFTAQEAEGDGMGWKYKTSTDADFTYNGVIYKAAQVQGQTNPLNGKLLRDGGGCSIAMFKSTTSGTLDVAFKFGYNKKFWVAAVPVADLALLNKDDSLACSAYKYEFTEGQYYWSGYLDPMTSPATYYDAATPNYTEAPAEGVYYTGITLNIVPDYEYYVYFAGSKLMLSGFTYTAAPVVTEYAVSGKVATSDGTAVEGVLITSSDSKTATTNASGEYSITGITESSITLTPSKTDYEFSPATITLTMDKDYTGQDFVASTGDGIPSQISSVTVVFTDYYTIIGQKLDRPKIGELNIIVNTMSDGTVKAEKRFIKE